MANSKGGAEKVPPFLLKEVLETWDKIAIKDKDAIDIMFDLYEKIFHTTKDKKCSRCIIRTFYELKKYYYLNYPE